jgi:hypothetical protein
MSLPVPADEIFYGPLSALGRGWRALVELPKAVFIGEPLFAVLLEGEDEPHLVRDIGDWRSRHRAGEFGADDSARILAELRRRGHCETERARYWVISHRAFSEAATALAAGSGVSPAAALP